MAQQGGREVTTPVVMGEQLDPPKYGESWSEAASRVFFAAYREYEQRVKFANAEGVVRRQLMGCLLYTSPSPRDKRQSRMPSSA